MHACMDELIDVLVHVNQGTLGTTDTTTFIHQLRVFATACGGNNLCGSVSRTEKCGQPSIVVLAARSCTERDDITLFVVFLSLIHI